MNKKKVAFICVHNSCRSQIAEALGKYLAADVFDAYSAGTETKPQINQDAVRLMKELYGIDMEATQYSKTIVEIPDVDIAISMGCNVGCPFIGRGFDDDWGLEDPTGKSDEEFKKIIQEIERRILQLKMDIKGGVQMERNVNSKSMLLKNAKIYDGSGAAAFMGDVLIEGERIVQVALEIPDVEDYQVVDLDGLSLAPGFIDAHSHNDWFALRKEPEKYFTPFIQQGITTFVSGNCGLAATGFADDTPHKDIIGGGLFFFHDCKEPKGQVKDFLQSVDGQMPCNLAVLAGHCTARASASGSVNRQLTAA